MQIKIYPKHIGFIADGNRTWATNHGLPKLEGHKAGFSNTIEFIKYIYEKTPIKYTTIWALSTENLKNREQDELEYLFEIYKLISQHMYDFLEKNKIDFCWKGNPHGLPEDLVNFLDNTQNKYKFGLGRVINLAVNYGGQDEIIRGILNYANAGNDITKINVENLSKYMDFGDQEKVDLIIRTKGDLTPRTSGFMSWRAGYSQLYFCPKLCPEFSIDDLNQALLWFDNLADNRNYGK